MIRLFFFSDHYWHDLIFFSLEKFYVTHSVIWKGCFFFRAPKKKSFSHTHAIFAEKSQKTNYSLEIKKYGTFYYDHI